MAGLAISSRGEPDKSHHEPTPRVLGRKLGRQVTRMPKLEAAMSTGTFCSTHRHIVPMLRDLRDAEPHGSALASERPIRRHLVWAGMAGRTLLALLFGSFVLATFVFRQDISLMFTLHQLRTIDGTPNIYRIEYYDDGWVGVNKIEPFELRQPNPSEYPAFSAQPAFHPMSRDDARDAADSNSLTK
jgi:hypothetical protein